jgi:indoleamine 2,3-dioxygenase
MPKNPLTDILRDFRTYRPANHNSWLSWLEKRAAELDLRAFAKADDNSAVLYLALLDQVREFRGRHWNFTKE